MKFPAIGADCPCAKHDSYAHAWWSAAGMGTGRGDTQQVQWNQRVDEKTMQRRQQQREAYLSKEGTTNTTNWLALAFGLVLVPAGAILLYAIQSGFLDEVRSPQRWPAALPVGGAERQHLSSESARRWR